MRPKGRVTGRTAGVSPLQMSLWSNRDASPGWNVRISRRARRLSMRVFPGGRVEVVVPPADARSHQTPREPRISAAMQARVQLSASDVNRVDPPGAAREQHLREAAGRRADVKADAAARIDPEMIEPRHELHVATRHPRMRRCRLQCRHRPARRNTRPGSWRLCRNRRRREGRSAVPSAALRRAWPRGQTIRPSTPASSGGGQRVYVS